MVEFDEITWGKGGADYPPELLKNMRPDDEVMAYIRIVGKKRGCLNRKSEDTGNSRFIAITRERIVGTVETSTSEGGLFSKNKTEGAMTINIPLVKVTSIETSNSRTTQKSGCLSKTKKNVEYYLTINAQGSNLEIFTGGDSTVNDEFVRSFLEVSDYF